MPPLLSFLLRSGTERRASERADWLPPSLRQQSFSTEAAAKAQSSIDAILSSASASLLLHIESRESAVTLETELERQGAFPLPIMCRHRCLGRRGKSRDTEFTSSSLSPCVRENVLVNVRHHAAAVLKRDSAYLTRRQASDHGIITLSSDEIHPPIDSHPPVTVFHVSMSLSLFLPLITWTSLSLSTPPSPPVL